jgi:hypothetical protein
VCRSAGNTVMSADNPPSKENGCNECSRFGVGLRDSGVTR